MPFALRYLGHRPDASLSYFTGASVTLTVGDTFVIPASGLTLGRTAGCDVRVASSQVARRHLVVSEREGAVWVEDLGTPNGTLVEGRRVTTARVDEGAVVTIAGGFDWRVVRVP